MKTDIVVGLESDTRRILHSSGLNILILTEEHVMLESAKLAPDEVQLLTLRTALCPA